jgi:hypothetical protein
LTLELPAHALEIFMDGYRNGDPRLLDLLKEFHILAIMPWDEQDLSRWENEGGQ